MKPADVLQQLEDTATQLGVRVSYEQLATTGLGSANHGGMCRVKGEIRVIIDKRATTQERVTTLASALARLDTSAIAATAKVRELLAYYADRPTRRAS